VVITELGGTVGDIEGMPFLEAIRQFPRDVGKENCLFIHLTLAPYLKAAGELKTKPTQQSVGMLRQIGIHPDILIVRTERPLGHENIEKIALFCNVEQSEVIEEIDKEFSIYEVPLGLVEHRLDQLIVDKLSLPAGTLDMSDWRAMLQRMRTPEHEVTIGVVGKYIEHSDAYKSIYEALDHGGVADRTRVMIKRIEAEELESQAPEVILSGLDGILVPGGFGSRGVEGKVQAIRFARENDIPYFGICLGMQCAVIEFARNVLGLQDAHSSEFVADTPNPVICMLEEQKKITFKGGTMRLGSQPCTLQPDSTVAECYQVTEIDERHRHRYEFNPEFRNPFAAAGMLASGTSPDGNLVEIMEVPEHPWFVAVQFHPEFKSKPMLPHPLFTGFVEAARTRHQERMSVRL
jgi:CTP synthase